MGLVSKLRHPLPCIGKADSALPKRIVMAADAHGAVNYKARSAFGAAPADLSIRAHHSSCGLNELRLVALQ